MKATIIFFGDAVHFSDMKCVLALRMRQNLVVDQGHMYPQRTSGHEDVVRRMLHAYHGIRQGGWGLHTDIQPLGVPYPTATGSVMPGFQLERKRTPTSPSLDPKKLTEIYENSRTIFCHRVSRTCFDLFVRQPSDTYTAQPS